MRKERLILSKREQGAPRRPRAQKSETLGPRVRRLRRDSGLTLKELGARTGLAFSTIAKVETSQISPTYENIIRLANGLGVDVTELFASPTQEMVSGRRTWTRAGEGARHSSPEYDYQMLCADIANKKFIPLVATIRARSLAEFPRLPRHQGEEFIFVLKGSIEVFTELYEPLRLEPGDSCYFDSTMGHACVSGSEEDAVVLWVCSTALVGAIGAKHAITATSTRATRNPSKVETEDEMDSSISVAQQGRKCA